jgi:hypothetical protein
MFGRWQTAGGDIPGLDVTAFQGDRPRGASHAPKLWLNGHTLTFDRVFFAGVPAAKDL